MRNPNNRDGGFLHRNAVVEFMDVVPERGTVTACSSGTAAVDRLVSETNGAGTRLTRVAGRSEAPGAGPPRSAAVG